MVFLTTVNVGNGPPGYFDVDYEYFYTDEYPTECELRQFENEAAQKYSMFHVRYTTVHTEMVKVSVPETQEPHGDVRKDPQQTTLEPETRARDSS